MWFDSWSDIVRVLLVGVCGYGALVLILRVSGKRTLSKLNAFDLIVTVALGSTLATLLLSSEVSWSEGVLALLLLIGAQWLIARLNVRLPALRRFVTAQPSLLLSNGQVDDVQLRRARVTRAELLQAVRREGVGDLDGLGAVVLESDGSFSVIQADKLGSASALTDVGLHADR